MIMKFSCQQRTVHNVIESDDGQVLWMGPELDMGLLTEDQDGGDITTEEGSAANHVASTSTNTRTVHIPVSSGLMVKKEDQVWLMRMGVFSEGGIATLNI